MKLRKLKCLLSNTPIFLPIGKICNVNRQIKDEDFQLFFETKIRSYRKELIIKLRKLERKSTFTHSDFSCRQF